MDIYDEVCLENSSLSCSDLCDIAEDCTHFKSNAENVFSDRFSEVYTMDGYDFDELKRLFRIFGSFIKTIDFRSLHSKTMNEKMIQMIITHCSGNNCLLESLKLTGFDVKPIFWHNFEKLEEVFFKNMEINSCALEHFIQLNPQIKCFSMNTIVGTGVTNINSSIFRIIGTYLTELEELNIINCYVGTDESIGNREENLCYLTRLKHLKTLSFESNLLANNKLLRALVAADIPIEILNLLRFKLSPQTCQGLSKLIQVERLTFDFVIMERGQLVELVEKLPNLNQLHIEHSGKVRVKDIVKIAEAAKNLEHLELYNQQRYVIYQSDFKKILRAVKDRSNGKKLLINIFGDDNCEIRVQNSVLKKNKRWIEIDTHQYTDNDHKHEWNYLNEDFDRSDDDYSDSS